MPKVPRQAKPRRRDTRAGVGELRRAIDRLDAGIVALLSRRARAAMKIGAIKAAHGMPPLDAAREKAVLKAVAAANRGPIRSRAMERIYRAIITACRDLERPGSVSGKVRR